MRKFSAGGLILTALACIFCGIAPAQDTALPPIPGGDTLNAIPDSAPAATTPSAATRSTPEIEAEGLRAPAPGSASRPAPAINPDQVDQVPAAPKVPLVGTSETPLVNKIKIVGGFASDSEIKARMGTREGTLLNRKVLEEDFQRLYKMGRFADVQIKEEQVPGQMHTVNIVVLLREKNVIKRVTFRGNKGIKSSKLLKLIKSKAGERYDEGQANRDARALEDEYKEKFYYFSKVGMHPEPFEDGVKLVFDIEEGHKLWIREIILRGNYRFEDKVLKNVMKTKQSSLFSRGKLTRRDLEEDLERLKLYYQSNGYLDATVTERPFQITANVPDSGWTDRREAYIYLDIEEGEQYRIGNLTFKGNKLVQDMAIRGAITSMPGKIYSPVMAADDAKLIRDIYGRYPNSRYFTKVNAERVLTEQPNVVDMVFHIEESPQITIEDVQIVGNTRTKDKVIRRELQFFPGELTDSKKINQSKDNLKNLDYFKEDSLALDVKEGSAGNRGRVVVEVEEKQTGNLSFGVGMSTQDPVSGSVTLSQRNFDYANYPKSFKDFITGKGFVGGGQFGSISASMGTKSQNYGLDFNNPWIFDKPVSWGFGPYWKSYEWDEFTDERLGVYTTLGRRLWTPKLKAAVTYRLENVNVRDIDSSASQYIFAEKGNNILSSMSFGLTWDSRNNVFDPEKGTVVSNVFKVVGGPFGGDYDFWNNYSKFQTFYPIFTDKRDRNYVLSFRTDFTTENYYGDSNHVPIYEKIYGGGIGSVRGLRQSSMGVQDNGSVIGGLSSQTNSLEFFVPVYEKLIKASMFMDIGGVFPDAWSINDNGNENAGYRVSVGPGIHVKTPLSAMPVRIYVPLVLNEKTGDRTEIVQFTFGAQF